MSDEQNANVATEAEVEVENKEGVESNQPEVKDEKPEGSTDKTGDEDYIPFPKKAQNAISRRDRTIGKLQARLRAIEQQYAEISAKPQAQETKKDDSPKQDDFETYAEYLEAKALWKVEQKFAERENASKKADLEKTNTAEKQRYVEQKSQAIASTVSEMIKTAPELKDMVIEHKDFMDSLPSGVQDAFFEAENPALAFYNMAKDGSLIELADMTPYQAAAAIARASIPVQKTTQAPKPMQGAKGTGTSNDASKIANDADAMRKFLKSKGLT